MRSPSPVPDPSSEVVKPRPVFPRTSSGLVDPAARSWLERAFELALFLLEDRAAALDAATRALARLRVTVVAQERRSAYVPRGRRGADGVPRATRTRVSVSDVQLLQRLVYLETDADERRQEEAGAAGEAVLTRRFVKHLVRCALRRNSFYVALGMSRLLHRYSTAEAQDLYSLLLQDPGRVPDDCYYRARRGQLIDELRERFGDRLTLVVGPRGEQRFESCENPQAWAPLVRDCLERLTPWDSTCALPLDFDARATELPRFAFEGSDPDGEHPVEVDRIHALLHPPCFRRLARSLRLSPPDACLDVPRFASPAGGGAPPRGPQEGASVLTDDEWQQARDRLRGGAAARGERGGVLYVSVDGGPRRRLDLERGGELSFSTSPLSERVDFEGEDGTLVASCLLGAAPSQASLSIAGRPVEIEVAELEEGALRLDVRTPIRVAGTQAAAALPGELRRLGAALYAWLGSPSPRLPLAAGAAAAVLVALLVRPDAPPSPLAAPLAAPSMPSPVPAAPQPPPALPGSARTRPAPLDTTRGLVLAPRARRLSEVQHVFVREVEPAGAVPALRASLAEQLSARGLGVSAEPAGADACLEIEVGRASSSRVRVDAKLVSVAGEVLWAARVEGKTDDVSTLAANVIQRLARAIRR